MARLTTIGGSAALSRELSDFLIEFSIGLHKNAIYPPGHPLLENTTSELSRRLGVLFADRATLSLGVARNQLIIEGVATDESNPVLRELAMRLHRHHLGAVKFSQGVTEDELNDMLSTVSVDAGRLPRPLGLEDAEVLTQWPHIRLFPLTFAQLQLIEEDPNAEAGSEDEIRSGAQGSRSAALWVGLARAALVHDLNVKVDPEDADSVDPKVVAHAIEETKRDAAYDQVVVGYLLQIAEELKTKEGKEAAALERRISSLVGTLSPETLQRLMHMGGDVRQRRKFVVDASQGMAVDAVVEIVRAAANTSGQAISHSMMRMLTKLAAHADGGPAPARQAADGALRDQVTQLMAGWQLDDPNPDSYRLALDKMASHAPLFSKTEESFTIEPERLLAMGLEIETLGDQVWRSADAMSTRGDLTPLLNLVDNAPSMWVRNALWRHVATPQRLRLQLALDPLPVPALQRMVVRMGAAAAEPLLDALESTTDEKLQEKLVELLGRAGPDAAPAILERLAGLRWGLVRPLMALLARNPTWGHGFTPAPWLAHPDAAVRREALRQMLRATETRDVAIVRALADADEQNVRLGLGAAMTGCPKDAAAMLRARADDATLSPDLRALGVRALSSYRAPETPAWLVARVVRKGRLTRRPTLAPKTPEMLAALEGLATHWREDKVAAEALALAGASTDEEVRIAVTPRRASRETPPAGTP
jgi:hypothetical protein